MIASTVMSMTWLMKHQMLSHHSIALKILLLNFFNINRDTDTTTETMISVKLLTQEPLPIRKRMVSTRTFMISFITMLRDSLGQDLRRLSYQMDPKPPGMLLQPISSPEEETISVKPLTQLPLLERRRMVSMRMSKDSPTSTSRDSLGQDLRRPSSLTDPRLLSHHPFTKDIETIETSPKSKLMRRFTVLLTQWLIESTGTDLRSHSSQMDPSGTSQLLSNKLEETIEISVRSKSMKRSMALPTLWSTELTGTDQRSHSCQTDPN